jgi:hypothetical protein
MSGRYWLSCFLAAITLLSMSLTASAGELRTEVQGCTTPECGATVLSGQLNKSDRCCGFANLPIPWTVQLYARPNDCLRLRVTSQPANTELVAIAPASRRTWRNDNSGIAPCPTCPLLVIRPSAIEEGWFFVQVNQTLGAPVTGNFVLKYARYAPGNPNCAPATPVVPLP